MLFHQSISLKTDVKLLELNPLSQSVIEGTIIVSLVPLIVPLLSMMVVSIIILTISSTHLIHMMMIAIVVVVSIGHHVSMLSMSYISV